MSATEWSLFAYAIFATVVFLTYLIVPKKIRWIVLLISSFALVCVLSSWWIIFLIFTIISIYTCGILIDKANQRFEVLKENLSKDEKKVLKKKYNKKKKLIMLIGVLLNILVLALLKYFNLPIGRLNDLFKKGSLVAIAFPILGISYYTLQAIGYLIDVYRGKYKAEVNIFKLSLFLIYFPQLIEGPIGRYDRMMPQFNEAKTPSYENVCKGSQLVLWGLFKKIVIADRINIIVSKVFSDYSEYSGAIIVLAAVLYAFQLYTDFSGYIDIASGISRMFGINLEKNFDRPFFSRSIQEFWRRWHMSLGSWLRDYVFYPVALSKAYMKLNLKIHGKVKPVFEKFISSAIPMFFVWLMCGIWHGAGWLFIVYGMYYYVLMLIGILMEPLLNKILGLMHISKENIIIRILAIFRTFVFVCIGLMMFRSDSLKDFFMMFRQVFKSGTTSIFVYKVINIKDFVVLMFALGGFVLIEIIQECGINLFEWMNKTNIVLRWSILIIFIIIILVFGAYGKNYGAVDPMYAIY